MLRKALSLLMVPPLTLLVLVTAFLIFCLRAVLELGRTEP
jgi:hypothetical protein